MRYQAVGWFHEVPGDPVELFAEIGDDDFEVRKVDVFADGRLAVAKAGLVMGSTELGSCKIPLLDEINESPEFDGRPISAAEFESVWAQAVESFEGGGAVRTQVPMRFPGSLLWTVPEVFSADECANIVEWVEGQSPALATNNPIYRDQDRVMKDDADLAAELFDRLRPSLPEMIGPLTLHDANDRLRFYRYGPGQQFTPHMDHWYQPDETTITLLSVLLYLNADYEGGRTIFMEQLSEIVEPAVGQVAVFQHKLRHEGETVRSGTKYLMRSDIYYRAPSEIELTFEGA